MVNPRHYEGRGQAFVKHTFLDRYMPAQVAKIGSWCDHFVYVDLFAGPWQSVSGDYSDTSFGIALRHLTAAKARWASNGRQIKVSAHLVEKTDAFFELQQAVARFPEVEVHCYHGRAEDLANKIGTTIPASAFRFVVIDPKGIPDLRKFQPLISAEKSEALLNFMFEFANRFAHTQDRMPTLEGWLGELSEDDNWRRDFAGLAGRERETAITDRARTTIQRSAGFRYSPAITVDETDADRPLYKLIYLTRHDVGIKVFRDAHFAALEAQADFRSARKNELRVKKTGMADMFSDLPDPGERSRQELTRGEKMARSFLLDMLRSAALSGRAWRDIWPAALDECVVTHGQLGRIAGELRQQGLIDIPEWTSARRRSPDDNYQLFLASAVETARD